MIERARALLGEMTLAEKVSQLVHASPAIERLGVPAHDWWNECLHGVARAGLATVFPQAIGLAATGDAGLVHRVATAISDEARAKHHLAVRQGNRGRGYGLTFWAPNINLFRDPRWGRGQETYGEDPELSARLAVAFVRGLQGDDPRWLKLAATPKHFAAHSGPEATRHSFDARVSLEDLRQSYLPQFEAAVREGKAASVMAAYNRLNGEPCASNRWLLQEVLRDEWGFDGVVVSDCGAIDDLFQGHGVVETPVEAAARALRAGCDLECGGIYKHLGRAVESGLCGEADVDRALLRVLALRLRLGAFDDGVPWAKLPESLIACDAHRELAREAARRSFVLLSNDGLLPLPKPCRVAVLGEHADSMDVLLGNYHGTPAREITFLDALRAEPGIQLTADPARADVAVVIAGLTPKLEGEEGDTLLSSGSGDRAELDLPPAHAALLAETARTGTPVVLVLTGGGAIAFDTSLPRAALMVWYPGEQGGPALADLLFGRAAPSGRLPVTFYRSAADLPPFEDYRMAGRTHRSYRGPVLFPFGHGLTWS